MNPAISIDGGWSHRATRRRGIYGVPERAVSSEKGRDWLYRDEIKSLIHDEQKEWRSEVRAFQERMEEQTNSVRENQEAVADKLIDGAQASLNMNALLVGDERFGIKGFIPEVKERLDRLERGRIEDKQQVDATQAQVLAFHGQNTTRLEHLEQGQHRLRRFAAACARFVAPKEDESGKARPAMWRIAAVLGGIGSIWPLAKSWAPVVGKKIVAVMHALR